MSKDAKARDQGIKGSRDQEFQRPGPAQANAETPKRRNAETEAATQRKRQVTIELDLCEPHGHVAERIQQSGPLTARQREALGLITYGCIGRPKRSAPSNVENAGDALRHLLDLVADAAGVP